MKIRSIRACSYLLIAVFAAASPLSSAGALPKESWLGLYFNGRKVGYTHIRTDKTSFRGKPALKTISTSVTRLELLGNRVAQDISLVSYTSSSFAPIYQEYRIQSGGSAVTLKADYAPNRIVCVIDSGGGPKTKSVPVPPGVTLIADSTNVTRGQAVAAGQKYTFHYLNPLTIGLERAEVEALGQEVVKLGDTEYTARRMSVTTPLGKFTSWETEEGEILKTDLALGMEMYREPKTTAMNMRSALPKFVVMSAAPENRPAAYTPPSDFAIGTAIVINTPITKPRETRSLSLVISGIDNKELIISDRRQHYEPVENQTGAYRLQVAAERFEPSQALRLPIARRTITLQKDTAVRIHLNTVPYLEYEHPAIMETAKKIRGSEKNAYVVASRIRKWVYENMKPDYTIGVPRSCVDIFKQRRGVCRDYATLFAALARAAGIPTRTVGGILYAEGRFFYHAWVECWVGEWVPFDATLNTDFVDATHIKFSQGDVVDMYNITGLIGRLKIRVESAE